MQRLASCSNNTIYEVARWTTRVVLIAIVGCSHSTVARGQVFNGVTFLEGAASFADVVIRFDPLHSAGPVPSWNDPERVLGPPGSIPFTADDHQPLGRGGAIELGFTDVWLTNDGTTYPELYIGEVQGTAEDVYVSLRPTPETKLKLDESLDQNGDGYYEMGRYAPGEYVGVFGFAIFLDIDQRFQGFGQKSLLFDAVQIMDDPLRGSTVGETVGMDLESVGVIYGQVTTDLPGDFNKDRNVDDRDVDLLAMAIRLGRNERQYDLNNDQAVTGADRDEMIHTILNTFYGDANLDGQFDSNDLVLVLAAGTYEDKVSHNATWRSGDWNGDLEFSSADLVVALQTGGYEAGPRAMLLRPVPEPGLAILLLAVLPFVQFQRD